MGLRFFIQKGTSVHPGMLPRDGYMFRPEMNTFVDPVTYFNISEERMIEIGTYMCGNLKDNIVVSRVYGEGLDGSLSHVEFCEFTAESSDLKKAMDDIEGLIEVNKAFDPNNEKSLLAFINKFTKDLINFAKPSEQNAIDKYQAIIKKDILDKTRVSTGTWEKVVKKASNLFTSITTVKFTDRYGKIITSKGEEMTKNVKDTLKKTGGKFDTLNTSFNTQDTAAIKAMSEQSKVLNKRLYSQLATEYEVEASKIVQSMVLEQGLDHRETGRALFKKFGKTMGKSEDYYNVVSNSLSVRSRSAGQLNSYAEVGFSRWQFIAVVDEVTSDPCRYNHLKIFTISDGLKTIDRANQAVGDEIKHEMPWLSSRFKRNDFGEIVREPTTNRPIKEIIWRDQNNRVRVLTDMTRSGMGKIGDKGSYRNSLSTSQQSEAGLMTPPLHGRCRSNTQPVD